MTELELEQKCRPKSLSLPVPLWKAAKKRAAELKMNLSEYVKYLIRKDLGFFND
jgi:macrodomain Ter protein organizer (MatP/YcbG family)